MNRTFICFILCACPFLFLSCCDKKYVSDIESNVRECDVIRTVYSEDPSLPLNQANGYFGGSFSQLGLHIRPENREVLQKYGNTTFLHVDRYYRGKFNMDYLIPVCRIYWGQEFADISDYEQHQSYYDGILTTRFVSGGESISVTSWFDPVDHDMACFLFQAGETPGHDVILEAEKTLKLHYSQEVTQEVTITAGEGCWKMELGIKGRKDICYVYSDAPGLVEDNCLRLNISGDKYVRIVYASPVGTDVKESLAQTKDWWHRTWQESAPVSGSSG